MFRSEGAARTDRQNRLVAGYLALVGGFVNSCGFVIIGTFTSHVTGNVGRFADDLALLQLHAAIAAMTMITAFLAGAFVASMAIESDAYGSGARSYAVALFGEGALLLSFTILSRLTLATHPRINDYEAAILCAAMGMQNSLVTRLSGAVVRTTHLTGVVTDVGIEAARWFRWWRGQMSSRLRVKLAVGKKPPERPSVPKIALLCTIAGAFSAGAMMGAIAGVAMKHAAMLIPSLAVIACGVYAFTTKREEVVPKGPDSRK
jgi:uncharacterized membrane protein YoaK (UPF0700 family)